MAAVEVLTVPTGRDGRVRALLPCGHGHALLNPAAAAERKRCPVDRRLWAVEFEPSRTYATFRPFQLED